VVGEVVMSFEFRGQSVAGPHYQYSLPKMM